mmetsp:Transcript_70607/g.63405  ORF Transcript_70607/g.63405 Transcript_70607/m.63405 type:complete len:504 (-) Transcript_70607:66-1577(-)
MATDGIPQDNMAPGPDAGQTTTQATTAQPGEFGSSEFGERLAYEKPKYQDLWAFILFYVHVLIIVILCIYFWGVTIPDLESETTTTTTTSDSDDGSDTSGVWVTLVCALFAGALFGMLWLQCMKMFAEMIIKILLFVQIGAWCLVAIMGVAIGSTYLIAIGIIFALFTALYTWCVWSRIPFAGACLSIASQIVQTYHGTVWLSLGVVVINFIWCIIWVFAIWAYFVDVALQRQQDLIDDPQCDINDTCTNYSNLIIFLYLISLYWGLNVWRNVSHTTTCGVAATWYFNPGVIINPSRGAFKRTMTTSFGSVCFGSLLVAILQAIRAMLRAGGKRGCVYCILLCIERIMRYFNKYAFAQVAIYGTSFLQSAKATWELFMNNGLSALINDDLSGLALTCGAVLGGVVSGIVGYLISQAFYPDNLGYGIALAWAGFILGYYACVILLIVVASGVVAIFVCFAEDPAACAQNRPEAFAKLTGVSPTMQEMAQNRGIQAAPQQQQQMA